MRQAVIMSPNELADRLASTAGPPGRTGGAWARLSQFIRLAPEEGFELSDSAVVLDGRAAVVWACLAIRSPGRTSLLMLGPTPEADGSSEAALPDAVRLLVEQESARGVALVQALLPPTQQAEPRLLLDCGFTRLAELIYMRTDLSAGLRGAGPGDAWPADPGEAVATYDESRRDRFARVIGDSYVATRDCPGLEGLRRIEDVLAGHRGSGAFRPDLWFLFSRAGGGECGTAASAVCVAQPPSAVQAAEGRVPAASRPVDSRGGCPTDVGVVLLNEVADAGRNTVELVYMGLAASARGRGLGRRMLVHAMRAARAAGYQRMILAVDSANEPAMRLYRRFAFSETMRRVAYILAPGRSPSPRESR